MTTESRVKQQIETCRRQFRDGFGIRLEDIQFAFVDSKDNSNFVNLEQFKNIFNYIRNATPFSTAETKVVEGGLEFEAEAKKKAMEEKLRKEKEERELAQRRQIEEQWQRQRAEQQRAEEMRARRQAEMEREEEMRARRQAEMEYERERQRAREAELEMLQNEQWRYMLAHLIQARGRQVQFPYFPYGYFG